MDKLFALYLGCTIVGMGLVLLSFLGDHGGDADADVDVDVDVDVDADVDVDVDADHDADVGHIEGADALWLPVLSLRFWIFFVAFFGLTGLLLHLVGHLSWQPVLGIAVATGLLSGFSVSRLVQKLRAEKVHGNIDPETDYVGREGEVLLVIDAESPGQVRLHVKGVDVDLPAITEGGASLERGVKVKVSRYAAGTLLVVPQEAA
ncbi:MAG: NfeD family protein [Planctomycetota bacterium]